MSLARNLKTDAETKGNLGYNFIIYLLGKTELKTARNKHDVKTIVNKGKNI